MEENEYKQKTITIENLQKEKSYNRFDEESIKGLKNWRDDEGIIVRWENIGQDFLLGFK